MHGQGVVAPRHTDPAVQLLADRAACHDLMMRYAAGVDRRDFDLVGACFVPDVDARSWGFEDRESLLGLIRGVAVFDMTMHMMGNQYIEVRGDDAAMDTYAMLAHLMIGDDGVPFEMNMSGNRYVEKLRRIDDAWVIVQRGGEPEWAPTGVTGVLSDDPAVRWLLDRAEITDVVLKIPLDADLALRTDEYAPTTHFCGPIRIAMRDDAATATANLILTKREPPDGKTEDREYLTPTVHLERIDGRWAIGGEGTDEAGDHPSSSDAVVQELIDRAEIADVITDSVTDDGRTFHLLGNQLIDIGGDEASVETYVYIARDNDHWAHGAARFVDNMQRTDGRWRIANREVADNHTKKSTA